MGRGDRRTRRGKIARGSYGKCRGKAVSKKHGTKKTTTTSAVKKTAKKPAKK